MIDAYDPRDKVHGERRLTGRGVAVILTVITSVLTAVEGVRGLYRHWTFVAVVLAVLALLVYASVSDLKRRSISALMSHLGLAIVLLGGLLSAVGRTDAYMTVYIDGVSPKQYVSTLEIGEESVSVSLLETCVNHPCRYRGYRIYQSGYDTYEGRYSVLKVVRDPWEKDIVESGLSFCR